MRYAFALISCLLAIAAIPAHADPVQYTIDFTVNEASPDTLAAPAAAFSYDASSGIFSDFVVDWDDNTYDLTDSANSPSFSIFGAPACVGGAVDGAATFALLTACSDVVTSDAWTAGDCCEYNSLYVQPSGEFSFFAGGDDNPTIWIDDTVGESSDNSFGTFSVSEAPEPSAIVLMLIGLCLLKWKARQSLRT